MIGFGLGETPARAECSSSGCREGAEWTISWRNPRIHAEDRVKAWAACDAHRDHLHDWLQSRDFPVTITPFGVLVERLD